MTYDEAVALLGKPARWCDGAGALAKLGDRRAVGPLWDVMAISAEGLPDRGCVREALETLGVHEEAAARAAAADVATRRTGIAMMKAFPIAAHVPVLARMAMSDPEASLRMLAVRALRTQKMDAGWDAAMPTVLDAPDALVRGVAAEALARRYDPAILAALRKRRAVEREPAVQAALDEAIALQAEH